ncbi:MAG: glycosyltransferase family 2 protein [Actinomycetota bacterium]|nr:glycosyltransferase family 2 protein [Actinomycetota bacterium]
MGGKKRPQVSFVIPSYQGEKLLPACLDSVLSQDTEADFEVIVVDDRSSDGSQALMSERYPQVDLVANRKNVGPAAAKNIGAEQARGELVAFLDNDVELDPGWLEAMLKSMSESGKDVGACASHILLNGYSSMLNSTGGMVNLLGYAWDRGIFKIDSESYFHNTRVMYACSAAMIARKDVFDEVGGFDESFRYLFEDADLGWRMNIYGYKVLYEPRAVADHLLSSTMGKKWLRNLYLYERNRLRASIKNMEADTLRWVHREMFYWFSHRMYKEMDNGLSARQKFSLPMRMAQAVVWNLTHLPGTMGRRREIGRHRKVKDCQLMSSGVLCSQIGEPPMGEDPRFNREENGSGDERRHLPRKLVVAREKDGQLGTGWFDREVDARGVNFRWTGDRAAALLRCSGKKSYVVLRTVMANPLELTQVSLKINGRPVSTFEVPNQSHLQKIPVPHGIEPGECEVELQVLNPFRPREALGIEDQRLLGIAVASVELR